ncbi:MAG: hypothetical protein ACREDR_41175 [Blastocatellia bacterium]
MTEIRYTLVADGSSDRALIPILNWLLLQYHPGIPIQAEWADLRRLAARPRGLSERIRQSIDLYPCDILFVHRDAERETRESRVAEINTAIQDIRGLPDSIRVVPVRMQEAWLLFDEPAIRSAAGNPGDDIGWICLRFGELSSSPTPNRFYTIFFGRRAALLGEGLGH